MATSNSLASRLSTAAFAFRGYNTTNLGRTPELLEHPAYGPIVRKHLDAASATASDVACRGIDLAARVRRQEETSLASYDEAIAADRGRGDGPDRTAGQFFGIQYSSAKMAYGYSLGELAAVVASGLFEMEHALRLPLVVAPDAVALTADVTLGILFSRGPLLDFDLVDRLCQEINLAGEGVIGMSSILAPNTVLLLGQGDTSTALPTGCTRRFRPACICEKTKNNGRRCTRRSSGSGIMPNRIGGDDADAAGPVQETGPAAVVAGDRQAELQRPQRRAIF